MELQHLNVKLFVADPSAVDLRAVAAAFSEWIQQQSLDGLLVDVADYLHVPAGPGVILIGHEANYSLDNAGNRLGLLYNRKAAVEGSPLDRLRQAVRVTLHTARRLEQEHGVRFNLRELLIIVNDRLLVPNTPESEAALAPSLNALTEALYGGAPYSLTRSAEPRERFTVHVQTTAELDLDTLLANLEREAVAAA